MAAVLRHACTECFRAIPVRRRVSVHVSVSVVVMYVSAMLRPWRVCGPMRVNFSVPSAGGTEQWASMCSF